MVKILDILKEFLKNIEENNPFGLVLKGGTALSIYYLNHHRESEDLDFDAEKYLINQYKEIENYLMHIFENLKQKQIIQDYKKTKSGFASTKRYHIKLKLKTHKIYYTKIDIDFLNLPEKLIKRKNLNLYSIERLFISKLITYVNRKEFKDLYDLAYLINKIDYRQYKEKEEIIRFIYTAMQTLEKEDIKKLFKSAFKNVDLRFKNLKESELELFIQKTKKKLHILINNLKKSMR